MIFVNPQAKVNRDIPNIGLAYAATHFNIKVIDQNTMPFPKDRFLKYETDVLGISIQSRTYSEAARIAKEYKTKYPEAKVRSISGFLDIQCCYPYLDLEDKIVYDEPFSENYPFPNYELFDSFDLFKKNWQSGIWSYAIMTSQGCPYHCIYCWSKERKWGARTAQNCFQELALAKEKWGIKSFSIIDDCFNIDKNRVIEFCKLIKPLALNWTCANGLRADRIDEGIAKAMAESGCQYVSFGIESVIPQVLEAIKKGETIEQIEYAVDIAKRYFKGINGFFIIGLPQSSYERDLFSLKWAMKKSINAHFSYYVPYDKVLQDDNIFYGEGAHPVSEEYPQKSQRKIYKMTKHMRPGCYDNNLLKRLINKFGSLKTR
jgi:radical SAM superfamily enzyme YgiQ (UPF0313 family)